jgi:CheY-like chemotaxis protein
MPKTLLLADDSVTIQKVVGISFANEDVTLVTVSNGDDAIARAREVRPDIVLADVVMPGKSGYEVCETIKADPALGHIPVLLLTGTFEPFDEARARRVRADGHITKPFEAQALVDEVNALLAAARPAAAVPSRPAPAPRATAPAHPAPVRPVAAPEPASSPADDAYDFFDQELTEPGESRGTAITATLVDDDLDVEATSEDEGLGFASELETPAIPVAPASAHPAAAPLAFAPPGRSEGASDRTVAILAEPPASPAVRTLGAADLTTLGVTERAPRAAQFRELATTRILDDLDTAPGFSPPRPAAPVPRSTPPPFGAADDLSPRPQPPLVDPLADVEPGDLADEAVLDPAAGRAFDVSSSDLGDPMEAVGSADLVPAATAAAAPTARVGRDVQAPVSRADFAPMLRERIHETLEKMAWEAFGQITETLVKDALERVEKIAWEVIPRMAETLIQEEIRRLKAGDGES